MAKSTDHADAVAACRALVLRYHRDIDRGRATAGIDVFAENAEFTVRGQIMRGRGEILGFLTDRERQTDRHTVHVIANEVVVAADDDHAELDAFVLLHGRQADGGYHLDHVLDTRHTFRRDGDTWLITRRTSVPLHAT
jgi:ketosteroid isomerase-like protein